MPPKLKTSTIKQRYRVIAAVRTQPCLYDPNKISENKKAKDFLWSQVASQCGIKSAQMTKLMWRKMYESYVAYRKNPQLNETSVYAMFFKHMKFIDPFIISQKDASNSPHRNGEVKDAISNQMETIQNFDEMKEETPTRGEFTTFQFWNETDEVTPRYNNPNESTTTTTNGNTHPNNAPDVEFNSESDVESYEDIILPEALMTDTGTADNSLKMFFDAMYASTSQFPPTLQRTVKMKIFSAVLEAEEEAENKKKDSLDASCLQIRNNSLS